MIKFILTNIIVVGFLIITSPILLICYFLRMKWPEKIDYFQLRMVQAAFKLCLFTSGVKVTVIGEENVPTDRAVLYVGNHTSFYDILLTYSRVKRLTGFVAKVSMKKMPLLNIWMSRLHCLFLDRDNMKDALKMILDAINKIKSGISIFIFPEGTRAKDPDIMGEFKEIS